VDLSGARLSRVSLEEANLAWANLERAILYEADLCGSPLALRSPRRCQPERRQARWGGPECSQQHVRVRRAWGSST